MPEVRVMGCIAIVCVLLFWFGYAGILAERLVQGLFSFRRSPVASFPPSFQTVVSVAFAKIIDRRFENFSSFF
jgi:hypothetical protein